MSGVVSGVVSGVGEEVEVEEEDEEDVFVKGSEIWVVSLWGGVCWRLRVLWEGGGSGEVMWL